MSESVARVTEVSARSTVSFEDAVKVGMARAIKTLRGVSGAWVKEQKVAIKDGKVSYYTVHLMVTFILDD